MTLFSTILFALFSRNLTYDRRILLDLHRPIVFSHTMPRHRFCKRACPIYLSDLYVIFVSRNHLFIRLLADDVIDAKDADADFAC